MVAFHLLVTFFDKYFGDFFKASTDEFWGSHRI